jgi:hypothetical protein
MYRLAVVAAISAVSLPIAAATGDQWQVASTMSMEGMPNAMPARVSNVCMPKTWAQPPGSANNKCTRSDFHLDGAVATWTETCENPPMTGRGEIARQGDAFTGAIKFTSPQGSPEGDMTINLSGHRTGDCEASQ